MRDFTLEDGQNLMSGGEITLTGLSSSTNYSIAVAAVNENGNVGLRSESLRTRTNQCNRFELYLIRLSVDAVCRDDTSEISRDPRTKRIQTRRESLAMPSKHTNKNF